MLPQKYIGECPFQVGDKSTTEFYVWGLDSNTQIIALWERDFLEVPDFTILTPQS